MGIPDSFKVSIFIRYFISQYTVKSINTYPVSMVTALKFSKGTTGKDKRRGLQKNKT